MQFKIILCSLVTAFLVFLSLPVAAIEFAFDNYTDTTTLSYSYSLNGKDWVWAGYIPATRLSPSGYIVFNFADTIPLAWKIAATNGKELQCVDAKTQKPVAAIITLNKPEYRTMGNLLLDVLTADGNKFTASIIDTDGGSTYSNVLYCGVD